jgi:Ca-activated chloride channel homolog
VRGSVKTLIPLAAQAVVAVVIVAGIAPALSPPGCTRFELSTSIEEGKIDTLTRLAERYNDSDPFVDGRCVEVSVHSTTSGVAMQGLRDGWDADRLGAPEPQVWTPTSSMWLSLLEESGRVDGLPPADEVGSIAQSLLVMAMPRRMAEALGWPEEEITWEEVLDLTENGWASRGHPEWGPFTFGKDDPEQSTSALGATVAAFLAAAQVRGGLEPDQLGPENLDDPEIKGFVQDIEAGVHNYDDDIIDTLRNLARYDADGNPLDYMSAVVLQEQLVIEYNRGAYSPADGPDEPREKLVVLYPEESTLRLDHPFVVLPSASASQRRAADDFRRFLRGADQQAELAAVGFRGRADAYGPWELDPEVAAEIGGDTVVDDRSLLAPPDGALIQAMLDTWRELRKPANVLLVLDISSSMAWGLGGEDDHTEPGRLAVVQQALDEVVSQLVDEHDVGFWTFPSGDPEVPWTEHVPIQPLPDSRDAIRSAIDGLSPMADTPLYRTVAAAYEEMARHRDAQLLDEQDGEERINAVIVLSDGGNNDDAEPGYDLEQLRETVTEMAGTSPDAAPVQVFTIGFSDDAEFAELEQIAAMTSAEAFDATDPDRLDEILPEVLDAL